MAVYLTDFRFRSDEYNIINRDKRPVFNNVFYPCRIFPEKGLEHLSFDSVTILYGGNGSGKSTAINIIAERLRLLREIPFKPGQFFEWYVGNDEDGLEYNSSRPDNCKGIPAESRLLTSEDVFNKTLSLRGVNREINRQRDELSRERDGYQGRMHSRFTTLHGPEYEAWKREHTLRTKSITQLIKEEVGFNLKTGSNGEHAFQFFMEKVQTPALYLLDEPENSLSAPWQAKLAEYIEGMARFEGCQFVIATHSPFLLGIRGAKIYDLDTYGVPVRSWTELENVREYFEFFKAREREFD